MKSIGKGKDTLYIEYIGKIGETLKVTSASEIIQDS